MITTGDNALISNLFNPLEGSASDQLPNNIKPIDEKIKSLLNLNNSLDEFSIKHVDAEYSRPEVKIGFTEIPFFDKFQDVQRFFSVWYPIDINAEVNESSNPLDSFFIGEDAPIAESHQKMPVVVISHGWSGNPRDLSWLISELVQANFLVIGIQHRDFINQEMHINHWKRARDISLVLDCFSSSHLAGSTDLNKIGIAGFSLGGTTALWVAGGRTTKLDSLMPGTEYASEVQFAGVNELLPNLNKEMMSKDWKDPRIKAAFIMAPAWSWIFDKQSLNSINIPTCITGGANDEVVKTSNNAGFFAKHIPNSIYHEIPGKVGHFIFCSAPSNQKRMTLDPLNKLSFLFDDDESIDRSFTQSKVAAAAVCFFQGLESGI